MILFGNFLCENTLQMKPSRNSWLYTGPDLSSSKKVYYAEKFKGFSERKE